MATGSVAEVTALLASWCERAPNGLALVEFNSELARRQVVANLHARLTATGVPFHELALPATGGPGDQVRALIAELGALQGGVVSISGFDKVFPVSGSYQDTLAAFNFQRERLAEPPLRQIWWLPVRVAEAFLRGAPDLHSWFAVRLRLTETITPSPADRRPIDRWIFEGTGGLPATSLEDARQRAAELARRFERALQDPDKPVEELASELMEPAVRALAEAGAEREARELERDLRRRAQERRRPLPAPRERRKRLTVGSLWNVPDRNPYFTGREDVLETLHQAFHREGSEALGQIQAISGLGGIGKTQTAVEYAYRYRDDYQAVLWTRAETEAELASGFSDLAAVLDLPEKDAKNQEEAIQAVKRWLASTASWLLVFDNADDPELIAPYLPDNPKGHILLTSRARLFDMLGIRKPLHLGVWPPEDSLTFLLERTERQDATTDEREAASALAEELGYLPLALEQAGAFMAEKQARFADYLRSFRSRRLRLLERSRPRAAAYPESVATTWAINLAEVGETSAELMRLSAFLTPERIPLEILILGASELGPTLSSALEGVGEDSLVLDELLEPLSHYSLIERDLKVQSFSVHRLVQEVVVAALDEEGQRRWAERAVRALSRAFPNVEVPTWPQCERLLPQATAALELFERYGLVLEAAADLFNKAGVYSQARGRYRQAAMFLEHSLAGAEKVLGSEHPNVAASLNNLANLRCAQGDYTTAAPLYERSLAIREKVLGPEHPDVASSLNNLALLRSDQADYAVAAPLYERSLAIREKVLGGEHPDVATSLNNLANLYCAQRNYEAAAPLYERSLAILESIMGPEHPNVALVLSNLANLRSEQGDQASAARLYERSLAIQETLLGAEHPDFARSLNNLANLLFAQGDSAAAGPLLERALSIFENALGPEHPNVARSLINLADLRSAQEKYESAAQLYERSLQILEMMLGPEHPDVAKALESYARLLAETDRADEAAALEARAKVIRENVSRPIP